MRIVHIFRAPIGGLFRHVLDLAREQTRRGHAVGVFCDGTFAGERNERLLADLGQEITLGINRAPMSRNPHWTDVSALKAMGAYCTSVQADVMHGHGAKGGLYARLGGVASGNGSIRAYTPHGGSLNYKPGTPVHRVYMGVERLLERGTDAFLFESQFIADRFRQFVGKTDAVCRVVLNGLYPHEVQPVVTEEGAADLLYIGEFRFAKGIDNLLAALALLAGHGNVRPSLLLVGQGPDEAQLREQVEALGLASQIRFSKPMAAREAFAKARAMVVPSRFESMPYVVIEAAGAGIPLVSTNVGGIPEIFGAQQSRLIASDDVPALARAIEQIVMMPHDAKRTEAEALQRDIARRFSVEQMASTVLDAYHTARVARGGSTSLGQAA